MKKRMALLGLLIAAQSYAADDFFYEEETKEEAASVRLEESVIASTGFETSLRNTASNVSIISSEQIEEKGYNTVQDALSSVPSINITEGSFGSSIDLRGQGGEKARQNVKILIDGVSITPLNKSHSTMPLESINIDNVESIEVIPGGGAVLYGNGTSGGVINIRTKSGAALVPVNSVKMEAGSYSRYKTNVSSGALITDDLLIQTNVSYEDGNGYLSGAEEKNLSTDILLKYKIDEKSDVSLKYERHERETSDPGEMLTQAEYDEDRNQLGKNHADSSDRDTDRDVITTTYNNRLTDDLQFSLQGTYQLKEDWGKSTYTTKANETDSLHNDIREESIDIKPKLQLSYGNGSKLVLGYDYSYQSSLRMIDGQRYSSGKDSFSPQSKRDSRNQISHGVYALNMYKINSLELTQGIRFNRTENKNQTTDRITPKNSTPAAKETWNNMAYELAANYLYSDTGNTFVRWERGFNVPDPSAIYDNPDPDTGLEAGIADVSEETYDAFEIGMRDFILGSYVSLTAFYQKTEDEIYKDGNSKYWTTYNLDETERKGIELSLEQYLGKLTLTEGYSYIDAEITAGDHKGNTIPYVSAHSFYVSGKYEFTSKVNTIVSGTYKSDVYANNENEGGEKNGHFITDFVVNYNVNTDLRVYAGINNLFNEKYYSDWEYEDGAHKYRAANERNYYAGASYTF